MRHEKFRRCNVEYQVLLTMNNGVLLIEWKEYNLMQRLFALENFYVEITSLEDSGEVIKITTHADINSMDYALSRIDISEALYN